MGGRVRKPKEVGHLPPKYVLKTMERGQRSAFTRIYFDKNSLLTDCVEYWGKSDMVVQQYVVQKTTQACIYRFYRNDRNVYRAECIINNTSIQSETYSSQGFTDLWNEAVEEV